MTDTQPQPGRELDVAMWRKVLGRKVYDMTERGFTGDERLEYPCMILGILPNAYSVYPSKYFDSDPIDWQPSTNLLHAFEVDREGWRWKMRETVEGITAVLTVETAPLTYNTTSYRFDQYTKIVMWHDVENKPAAHALARCRCALSWWQAQAER